MFAAFDINYSEFIRTTDDRHKDAVLHFWVRPLKVTSNLFVYFHDETENTQLLGLSIDATN